MTIVAAPPGRAVNTFLDEESEARFGRDGYVVLRQLLSGEEIAVARDAYRRTHPATGRGFFTDLEFSEHATQVAVADALQDFWKPHVTALFADHRVFYTSFLMKWPDETSQLALHQDWTYVDEERFTSAAFWVALDDASLALGNGPLHVLPGSHRLAVQNRGPATRAWYEPWDPYIKRHMVEVPVAAGDAVIMDNRLLHWSPPNQSGTPRLAVAAGIAPRVAGLRHVVDQGDDSVRIVEVDERFFVCNSPAALAADPPGFEALIEIAPRLVRPATASGMEAVGGEPVEAAIVTAATAWDRPYLGGSEPPAGGAAPTDRVLNRLLAWNHGQVVRAIGPRLDAEEPRDRLPWLVHLEDAAAVIRAEYLAATADLHLPSMSRAAGAPMPVSGRWDALVLRHNGGWVELNARRLPQTTAALQRIPGLRAAVFSVLAPGAVINPHRGVNNGVLRVHLGVVVPGAPGACALQAGRAWLPWSEGHAFAFDDTWEHRVVSRADGPRVSLMLEVERDLPGAAGLVNRLVQAAFRLHPQVRGASRRTVAIDAALNG